MGVFIFLLNGIFVQEQQEYFSKYLEGILSINGR